MIKYLLKRYMPQWVLAIVFLLGMIILQIGNDLYEWYKDVKV